ncbi:MAG: tetratricopeptide repeat protein, partial [Pseudomonadota bacterium]
MPILETVGGVLGTSLALVGRDAFLTDWFDGCKKRIVDQRRVPGNRDIVKGIRTAHLCALRHVANTHQEAVKTLPPHALGSDDAAFSNAVLGFLDERLRRFREHKAEADVLTLADLDRVFDEILKPAAQEGFVKTRGREQAVARALEEISRDAGREPPNLFLEFFHGQRGAAGWYDTFSLFIAEEIKTNTRFRTIFQTGQMVELAQSLETLTTDLLSRHGDLTGFMDDVHGQLDRIEAKLDAVLELGDVKVALATAESQLGTTRDLARTFFRIVLKRDVPDDQIIPSFMEAATLWQNSNPDNAVNRWGNLAPELDDLIAESKRAYAANAVEDFYAVKSRIVEVEEQAFALAEELEREATDARKARQGLLVEALQEKESAAKTIFNVTGTVSAVMRRVQLETEGPDKLFEAQRLSQNQWWESGRDKGLNFDLKVAIGLNRAMLEEYPQERAPLDWARAQNNLGNALATLGTRESGTERLDEAVAAYRAALEEWTQGRVPLDWAMTQNNLGTALWTLGARERGTERLDEAVAAYRAALEEWTQERVPLDWAMTQNNLGTALWTLGARERGTERLDEAVTAY